MGDYTYTPPPPPPQSSPPPVADDCNEATIGLNLQTLLDIEAGDLMGGGLLPNAQLLKLEFGETSAAIGNPLAPECSDQQTAALIDLDVSELPMGILGETGFTGDLLHLTLGDATARIGSPFASEFGDEDTTPLIDINTQSFPLDVFGGSGGDDSGALLASLLGSGPDTVGTATGFLSSLLGTEDSSGGSDCGCGGILQPVLDLVLNPIDGLLA